MRYLPLILGLSLLQTACASVREDIAHVVSDPNSRVLETAQTLTAAVFTAEQPALNAAVALLPPETQALAQAAYAALQKAIDEAMVQGVDALGRLDKRAASKIVVALSQASDTIHEAIHTEEAIVAAPTQAVSPNLLLPPSVNVAPPQP